MAFYQWRRFNFFDIAKDVDGGGLKEALNVRKLKCNAHLITLSCSHRRIPRLK